MGVIFKDGGILFDGTSIAMHEDCCCEDEDCSCDDVADTLFATYDLVPTFNDCTPAGSSATLNKINDCEWVGNDTGTGEQAILFRHLEGDSCIWVFVVDIASGPGCTTSDPDPTSATWGNCDTCSESGSWGMQNISISD